MTEIAAEYAAFETDRETWQDFSDRARDVVIPAVPHPDTWGLMLFSDNFRIAFEAARSTIETYLEDAASDLSAMGARVAWVARRYQDADRAAESEISTLMTQLEG